MWVRHDVWFSLFDVLLLVHLRQVLLSLKEKIWQHCRYMRAFHTMQACYTEASAMELAAYNDVCVICMERMSHAVKLHCGHIFHPECLHAWLWQESSCPTCRDPLGVSLGSRSILTSS